MDIRIKTLEEPFITDTGTHLQRNGILDFQTKLYVIDPTQTVATDVLTPLQIEALSIESSANLSFAKSTFADSVWLTGGFDSSNYAAFKRSIQVWLLANLGQINATKPITVVVLRKSNTSVFLAYFANHSDQGFLGYPYGTGGDLVVASGDTYEVPNGSVLDFNSIMVESGGQILVDGGGSLTQIFCAGDCTIDGAINVSPFDEYSPSVSTATRGPQEADDNEVVSFSWSQSQGGNGASGLQNHGKNPGPGGGGGSAAYGNGGGGGEGGGAGGCFGTGAHGNGGGNASPSGGGGGGDGAGDGAPGGGGGHRGAHGSPLFLKIRGNLYGTGSITSNGSGGAGGGNGFGTGSNCDGGGGGGGAGGSGGPIWVRHGGEDFSSLTYQVIGSGGGAGGAYNGAGGATGATGQVDVQKVEV